MPALLFGRRIARSRWMLAGLVVVVALALAAAAAPWLAPGDPYRGELTAALRAPSTAFPLGTDAQGRDVLSRVLFGARLSLAVGLTSQVISLATGLLLGLLAGFRGRWVDAVVMRAADVTLAFPSLLLLIAVAAAVAPGRVRGYRGGGVGRDGAPGPRAGARRAGTRLRAGGAGARGFRRAARGAPRAPERARPDHRGRDARRRKRDHGGGSPLVRRARRAAAHTLVGRHDRRGPRPAAR